MKLTEEQIAAFRRDGFLLLRGFTEASRVAAIRTAALEQIAERMPPVETEGEYAGADNPTLRRLRQVYGRDPRFRAWMTDPAIRPALAQLLGETPVLTLAHHNSIMTKMPGRSTETCWHQDRRYWHFENDNLLSVWLALGEETAENGVLEFIPGSHRLDFAPERFDAKTCFRPDLDENAQLIATKTRFDLYAGDVVLFHCRTLHHADANRSQEPKIAFVYTVRGMENHALSGTRSDAYPEIVLT